MSDDAPTPISTSEWSPWLIPMRMVEYEGKLHGVASVAVLDDGEVVLTLVPWNTERIVLTEDSPLRTLWTARHTTEIMKSADNAHFLRIADALRAEAYTK